MKLTDGTARSLASPAPGKFDITYFDEMLPGFGVRVLASGRRSWIVRYRMGVKQRVITLGTLDELKEAGRDGARARAQRILADANTGTDARLEIQRRKAEASAPRPMTVAEVIERHLASCATKLRQKSLAERERYLRKVWTGLHRRPARDVTRSEVATMLQDLAKKAPIAANRARSALQAAWTWAVRSGLVEHDPIADTPVPSIESRRERIVSLSVM